MFFVTIRIHYILEKEKSISDTVSGEIEAWGEKRGLFTETFVTDSFYIFDSSNLTTNQQKVWQQQQDVTTTKKDHATTNHPDLIIKDEEEDVDNEEGEETHNNNLPQWNPQQYNYKPPSTTRQRS